MRLLSPLGLLFFIAGCPASSDPLTEELGTEGHESCPIEEVELQEGDEGFEFQGESFASQAEFVNLGLRCALEPSDEEIEAIEEMNAQQPAFQELPEYQTGDEPAEDELYGKPSGGGGGGTTVTGSPSTRVESGQPIELELPEAPAKDAPETAPAATTNVRQLQLFSTSWCEPCKLMKKARTLEQLVEAHPELAPALKALVAARKVSAIVRCA